MINDAKHEFADAQAAFITDDVVLATGVIDFGVADPNQGAGQIKKIRVTINTQFTGGTSIQGMIVHAAAVTAVPVAADFVADAAKLLTGPVILIAAALPGVMIIEADLPTKHLRYVGVLIKCVGAVAAGKIDAQMNLTT